MSIDWDGVAKDWWDDQPHPHAPSLRIKEFATAVKLATLMKFGGHAAPHEAAMFWPEFQATGMSPEEFEHTLDRIAPLSYTFHGRPPTMHELAMLRDKHPHEARKYFADLPDRHYPDLTSGEMVKALQAADPHAREHLDRPPNKLEARYLHHSGESPSDYFARIALPKPDSQTTLPSQSGVQTQVGPDGGGRGMAPTRGSAPNQ